MYVNCFGFYFVKFMYILGKLKLFFENNVILWYKLMVLRYLMIGVFMWMVWYFKVDCWLWLLLFWGMVWWWRLLLM